MHGLIETVDEVMGRDLAEQIVRRVVTNVIEAQWTRHLEEALREAAANGDALPVGKEELLQDALAVALGEDAGCLDEEELIESVDLLWVRELLARSGVAK
jgi:hypothetical protein